MSRPKHTVIEYRNYDLPTFFPILLLTGDIWRISDIRSDRLHFHNCLEIGLCETDSGTMEFMDKAFPFKAGDVTIVASDISHTSYSSPGTASKWSYIFVDIERFFYPYFQLDLLTDYETLQILVHNYYAILSSERYPEIYSLVHMIIEELKNKNTNFQFTVRWLMLSLMIKLMNIYTLESSENHAPHQVHENSLVISPALDYIRNNYMQEFSVDILADICHMSSTHFRRTFTSIMGTGPLEYLNRLRISTASVLLRTTEMPILDISEEVGFHSVSSFNRHFSEIMGVTPMKWRKQTSYIRNQSVLKYTGWLTPPKDH